MGGGTETYARRVPVVCETCISVSRVTSLRFGHVSESSNALESTRLCRLSRTRLRYVTKPRECALPPTTLSPFTALEFSSETR